MTSGCRPCGLGCAGVARSFAKHLVGHRTDLIYSRYAIMNETDVRDGLGKVLADVAATKPIVRIGRA